MGIQNEIAPTATDQENHEAGLAKLNELGLAHLGDIQVDAGEFCKGSLAQFIGDAKHERVAAQVVETAATANAEGKSAEEAVLGPLAFFVKKDEQGDYLRVETPNIQKKK